MGEIAKARPEDAMSQRDHTRHAPESGRTKSPGPANRRAAERKRQRMIEGFISSRTVTGPCTICDISSTGSKVALWNDSAKPLLPGHRVTLYIPADRKEIDGEVVWSKWPAAGLRFTSAFRKPTRRND